LVLLLPGTALGEFSKGPAVQHLTGNSAVIFVHSDAEDATLEWGISAVYDHTVALTSSSGEQNGHRAWHKEIDRVIAGWVVGSKDGWIYEFALTGLEPDTIYHYRVVSSGTDSGDLTFRTAPLPRDRFVFIVSGDNKAKPDVVEGIPLGSNLIHSRLIGLMAPDTEIRTFIDIGDIVDDSNPDANWSALYRLRGSIFTRVAWFPSMGNHDFDQPDDGFNFQAYVNAPRTPLPAGHNLPVNDRGASDDTELFYSYDFGGVHFIAFNGNLDMLEGSPQHQFISDDLAANRCRGPVVVYGHQPWFSSAAEGGVNATIEAIYHPLFVDAGVDMVFFGHRHFYERMNPDRLDGILYMVAGGAGAGLDEIMNPPRDYSLVASEVHHYVRIEIEGWNATGTTYDQFDNEIDSFSVLNMYLNDPIDCRVDPTDDGGPVDAGVDGSDGSDGTAQDADDGAPGDDGGVEADDGQPVPDEPAAGDDAGVQSDETGEPAADGDEETPSSAGCDCNSTPAGGGRSFLLLLALLFLARYSCKIR
jgi:MYXO-CTERM domain-containing protein